METRELKTYHGRIDLSEPNVSGVKIINRVREGARVLEVGCATGYMSEIMTRQKGCRVTGIEFNPEAAAIAETWCDEIIVGDLENGVLDRVRGRFDVIIFADVLEHLRSPETVLASVRRLLNDAGYVLISVPNVAHWRVRKDLFFGKFEYTTTGLLDSTHLRFFTYDSIKRLIWNSGFGIEEFDVVHNFPARWCCGGRCRSWSHLALTRVFGGLFGYQFIFRANPSAKTGLQT